MTEERVYLNSEHFKNSFNEEAVSKIIEISKMKIEISKLTKRSNNLKYDYKSLIVEKQFKSIEFQREYNRLSDEYFGEELKSKWKDSKVRSNLHTKMTLIKALIRANQKELKDNKLKINELTRKINIF